MKIRRSSKATLKFATRKKRELLKEIMKEYSKVVNFFIEMFWGKNFTRQMLLAPVINSPDTWFSARMRQCAAREALGMIESAEESAKEKEIEAIKPIHTGKKMILSAQVVKIEKGRNCFDLWLVLYSIGRAIKISLPLKRHRHFNFFADWEMSNSVVIHEDHVQFSFERETGPKKTQGEQVGIDVGINHLLATSQGELFGSEVKQLIGKIKSKRQGSRAYVKAKKTLSYYLHKVVKEFFRAHDLLLVVVEALRGLKQGKSPNRGKEFRKTLSNWNYRELLDIIQMRTEENRVSFRSVNPYKTSQQCPICSHTERGNRSNEKFCCLRCGYSGQADIVGARNILDRFISGQYGAAFQAG